MADPELVAWIQAVNAGKFTPPYIPSLQPKALARLCQQAVLLRAAGFSKEAGQLAFFLRSAKDFPSLWCPEKEFEDLFPLDAIESVEEPIPGFDVEWFQSGSLRAAFSSCGPEESGLGVVLAAGAEIRAFGPQDFPLSAPRGFGLRGAGSAGWSQVFSQNEVWLHRSASLREGVIEQTFKFIGIRPQNPLSLAFYVKAPDCKVGGVRLKPGTLDRFIGEGKGVQVGSLQIESSLSHKIHVVPLAGAGGFWNCDFLIAFEIHPLAPQFVVTLLQK